MEIILVMGLPASGKTTYTKNNFPSHTRLNRDEAGGTYVKLAKQITPGQNYVLDNVFATRESRWPFLEIAQKLNATIKAIWIKSSMEEAQYNACERMIRKYGKLLSNDEIKAAKDPNAFPAGVLFSTAKKFEAPGFDEGFSDILEINFKREPTAGYTNKALILDYDGTLRETKSGEKYPRSKNDIDIKKEATAKLKGYLKKGYILAGVSNQSGIGSGKLTTEQAVECFEETNRLLGVNIDYQFCPHSSFPIACFCRKPGVGLAVTLIEKYKLDAKQCIFVGDMKTDETFAKRAGFKFCNSVNAL